MPSSLVELSKLNDTETKMKEELLRLLKPGHATELAKIIPKLGDFRFELLYALSEQSKEINLLLETNELLASKWSKMLKNKNRHHEVITSFDKKITLTILSQIKGALILSLLSNYSNVELPDAAELLNKACEIGMYDALIMRLNLYAKKITNEKDFEKLDSYVAIVMRDALKISNLYWALGCIDAALILFDVVKYYILTEQAQVSIERFFKRDSIKFSWVNAYESANPPLAITALEAGMEYLYLAKEIANFPQSKAIITSHNYSQNVLEGLKGTLEDPKEFEKTILDTLEKLKIPLIETFCNKATEQAHKVLLKYYPDSHCATSTSDSVKLK